LYARITRMNLTFISLALLALAAAAGLLAWYRASSRPAVQAMARSSGPADPARARVPQSPTGQARAETAPIAVPAAPMPQPVPEVPPPDGLLQFNWIDGSNVRPGRQAALVDALRHLPRPPATLHKLLSPHFLDSASSSELSELINGEAQIAAKVLATINSPAYGLQQPVTSIGHAVTFLGLNTVRGICLRYLLDDAFKPIDPGLQKTHARLWQASALASELSGRLAPKLGLAEPGALVAQVLLSFLGHVTTATLMRQQSGAIPPEGLLDRIQWSQERLGLGASEIGGLLLRQWGLPSSIVDDVVAIDRMAVTPVGTLPAARARRLAVAYFCARQGERLAAMGRDLPVDLASPDTLADASPDGYHLRSHLACPDLARLGEHLRSPAVANPVHTLLRSGRHPR